MANYILGEFASFISPRSYEGDDATEVSVNFFDSKTQCNEITEDAINLNRGVVSLYEMSINGNKWELTSEKEVDNPEVVIVKLPVNDCQSVVWGTVTIPFNDSFWPNMHRAMHLPSRLLTIVADNSYKEHYTGSRFKPTPNPV